MHSLPRVKMQGCASGEGSERVGGRARAGSGTDPQSTCAMSKTSLPVLPERSPAELPLPVLFPAGDACPYSPYTGGEQTQSGSHSVPAQHIPTRGSKWSWWDHSGSSHLCGALSPGPLTCTTAVPHSWTEPSPCYRHQLGSASAAFMEGIHGPSFHPHPPPGLVLR